MEYKALYREYRPKTFEEVVGQEHVVEALRNSVKSGRIAHAYLLSGTRGTGKTSIAKIFSRAINCLDPQNGSPCNKCSICKAILSERLLDVIEIDAASNNSVDNVRDIRDEVVYLPSEAKYKVYIIDEVHMLSSGAFNALLKTLEEPPAHVIFILATTEPQKLPATILSRCQRYDFKRISQKDIFEYIKNLCGIIGITAEDKALRLIAKVADGAMRDALSVLDKCISIKENDLTFQDVFRLAGISDLNYIKKIVNDIEEGKIDDMIETIDVVEMEGTDLKNFVAEVIGYLRNLLVCILSNDPSSLIVADDEEIDDMKSRAAKMGKERILEILEKVSSLNREIKWIQKPRIFIEVGFIELTLNRDKEEVPKKVVKREILKEAKQESKPEIKEEIVFIEKEHDDELAWRDAIKKLQDDGNMLISAYLQDTRLHIDGKKYTIIFKDGDTAKVKTIEKKENIEKIEKALSEVLKTEITTLKCEIQKIEKEKKDIKFSEKNIRSFFKDIPIEIVEN